MKTGLTGKRGRITRIRRIILNESINGADIENDTVGTSDIRDGAVGPHDLRFRPWVSVEEGSDLSCGAGAVGESCHDPDGNPATIYR